MANNAKEAAAEAQKSAALTEKVSDDLDSTVLKEQSESLIEEAANAEEKAQEAVNAVLNTLSQTVKDSRQAAQDHAS